MEKIISPLQLHDKGPEVGNLQAAILAIAERSKSPNFIYLLEAVDFKKTLDREIEEHSFGEGTRQLVSSFQEYNMGITPTGIIDNATAVSLNSILYQYQLIPTPPRIYIVQGTVYDSWLQPLANTPVMVFDKELRSELLLGDSVTDTDGAYSIQFGGQQFAKTGKKAPDIIVRIYGEDGNLLSSSNINYNAPQYLRLDVNLSGKPYPGPSEFEMLVAGITQLINKLPIDELTENNKVHDISFLASKLNIPASYIIRLIMAYRFEKWTRVPAQAFYAMLRQNVPPGDLNSALSPNSLPANIEKTVLGVYNALWFISVPVMMKAIQQSAEANIVPFVLTRQSEAIQSQLEQLIQSPPLAPGQTAQASPIYQKIGLAGLNAQQQQAFLKLYPVTGATQALWSQLSQDASFAGQAAVVDKLQAVFQLSALTSDNMALTAALLQKNNIAGMAGIPGLAGMDATAWEAFITSNNLSASIPSGLSPADYAGSLANIFEQAYPMPAFTARATTAAVSWQSGVSAFLQANPAFDLANVHVNLFLGQQNAVIAAGTDQKTLSTQLMAIQRIYKIAPTYAAVNALVQNGIVSARQVYTMGKSNFINKYTGKLGQNQPADVYEKAAIQYAGGLAIFGRLNSLQTASGVAAFSNLYQRTNASPLPQAYPDLYDLFGVSDYCECLACNSITSQAAYLTDILEFLNQRIANYPTTLGTNPVSVREILLANGTYPVGLPSRRSDIGYIDLDCTNTNVYVPYIDIVNELLEDYIAPPVFTIPNNVLNYADLTPGTISKNLLDAILELPTPPAGTAIYNTPIYNISLLTENAIVSPPFRAVEYPYSQAIIRDEFITLKLAYGNKDGYTDNNDKDALLFRITEIHETHLTADQISANPEYVNANIYEFFQTIDYTTNSYTIPFGLPFDLYFTEANLFLDKMGIHLYQLIKTFKKENESTLLIDEMDFFMATSYLNISLSESGLIFFPNSYDSNQQGLWGSTIWSQVQNKGAEVDTFLLYTGLNYEQLQDLLTLVCINGPGANTATPATNSSQIVQQSNNLTCDTSMMTISNLLQNSALVTSLPDQTTNQVITAHYVPPKSPLQPPGTTQPVTAPPTLITLTRLDAINRFLRLWPKTNISMQELDACLMAPNLGNGHIDLFCGIQLRYFLQLMSQFKLSAMQLLSFYQDIDTTMDNSLYDQLFQNLSISNPLNPNLNPVNFAGIDIDSAAASGVMQVIMTACNISSTDLQFLIAYIKGTPVGAGYDQINLPNLSFIYRCSLLANALKLSVTDLFILIGLIGIQPIVSVEVIATGNPINPQHTAAFVEKFKLLQNAGFSVDDLLYALTNQSIATPSLVPAVPAVTAGLSAIRTALQTVEATTTVIPDPKGTLLGQWLADPVLNWDKGIASRLISILGTASDASYITAVNDNFRFLQLLCIQYAVSDNTAHLAGLPCLSFPDASISGLSYDKTTANLGFAGTMSVAQENYLLALNTTDSGYKTCIESLFTKSQTQPFSTVSLAALPAGVVIPDENVPQLSYFTGTLSFAGPMSGPVYLALLAQSTDPGYRNALNELFIYSQDFSAGSTVSVALAAMPVLSFPDSTIAQITYDSVHQQLDCNEQMSIADYMGLLALSTDNNYVSAVQSLFINSRPGQGVSASLPSLPAWSFPFPDNNLSGIAYAAGDLQFTGTMSTADLTALLALSDDAGYQTAVGNLFVSSRAGTTVTTPLAALPSWSFSFPDSNLLSISYANGIFGFTGAMSSADLMALLALSNDVNYQAAICHLFSLSQPGSTVSFTPAAAPAATVTYPDKNLLSIAYAGGNLSFTGVMSQPDNIALQGLSAESTYKNAIQTLYNNSQASQPGVTISTPLALPASWVFSFPDNAISSIQYSGGALSFTGTMSLADFEGLTALSNDSGYQTALRLLFANSQLNAANNSTPLSNPASWKFTFPDSNIITLAYSNGTLSFSGQMSAVDYQALSGLSADDNYLTAIKSLFASSQTNPQTNSVTCTLASIGLPDANLASAAYTKGLIVCTSQLSPVDFSNLLQVNPDPVQQAIVNFLYSSPLGTSGTILSTLPPISFPATIPGLNYSNGVLSITGVMSAADHANLLALSSDSTYQIAINSLYANSTKNPATTINTIVLPVLPLISISAANMAYSNGILSIQGVMTAGLETTLLGLSNYRDYQDAIKGLFANSNLPGAATSISFAYPVQTAPLNVSVISQPAKIFFSGSTIGISTGPLSQPNYLALLGLSTDVGYQTAINSLYIGSQSAAAGALVSTVSLALPAIQFPGIYSAQLTYDPGSQALSLAGYIAIEDLKALLSFNPDTYYQGAIQALYDDLAAEAALTGLPYVPFPAAVVSTLLALTDGNSPDALIPARYAYFLNAIQPYYEPLKLAVALKQQLSTLFQINAPAAAQLIAYPQDGVYSTFTDNAFVNSAKTINAIFYPEQFYCYAYCARIAFFVNKFRMSAADIGWLLANSKRVGAIDFLTVPGNWQLANGQTNPNATFSQWETLNNFYLFQKKYNPVTIPDPLNNAQAISLSVFDIVQQAMTISSGVYPATAGTAAIVPDPGSFVAGLLALTGWNATDLGYLLNLPGARSNNPLHLKIDNVVVGSIISLTDIHALIRLQQCMLLAGQLKISVERCYTWSTSDYLVTPALADDIKQGLKAQYNSSQQWNGVIIPLQNSLRESRRDALLAFILANPNPGDNFNSEYDVYSKFLIDLEMSSCQPTTRIVQAYCAVQLFVQRCLMNLEPNVPVITQSDNAAIPFDEDWTQWNWMKTYDSWKYNRMVFLYPENYIQPNLLPNQSSFFQDMQNDLTQNQVTESLAETAMQNYVVSLDTVARLQVVGQWYDDASNTLHVIGSSYGGSPTLYYYRTQNSNRVWSPWEKVDLDIPDGHVVPVVSNGRIYLFWPVFTKTTSDDSNPQTFPASNNGSYTMNPPNNYWSIQMAFSEYQNGTWSPKKVSVDSIQTMLITPGIPFLTEDLFPDKSDFTFIAWDIPAINPSQDPIVNLQDDLSNGNSVIIGCYYSSNFIDVGSYQLYISSSYLYMGQQVDSSSSAIGVFGDNLFNSSGQNTTTLFTNYNSYNNQATPGTSQALNSNITSTTSSSTGFSLGPISIDNQSSTTYNAWEILNIPGFCNAFQLDLCRGYPEATVLTSPLVISGSSFFSGSAMENMLDIGMTPLSYPGQPGDIINPPALQNYANELPMQMGIFDKYLYIKNNTQYTGLGTLLPFFYQDSSRTYYVSQEIALAFTEYFYADLSQAMLNDPTGLMGTLLTNYLSSGADLDGPSYHFYNFYHPYACKFIQLLLNSGVDALQNRNVQLTGDAMIGTSNNGFDFYSVYAPGSSVYLGLPIPYWNGKVDIAPAYPKEDVDFDLGTGYGLYNWELFFHSVLLTAMNLSQNQQFQDADKWFKYIFNPTDTSNYPSPQKYWVTKPFFAFASDNTTVTQLITQLDSGTAPQAFIQSVTAMRSDPDDPFAIAQDRTLPYMITAVMKYLDNLIAWGDSLFTQHTMESVNLALQMYLLAQELLGPQPQSVPSSFQVPVNNYYQLEASLNSAIANNPVDPNNPWPSLSDPLAPAENIAPMQQGTVAVSPYNILNLPTIPSLLYFCIPPNKVLLQYWNTVADRLYKIRHCENILGQFDPLSPFPTGDNPANTDADDLNDLNGMQLYYRFTVMVQKSAELCNEVKSLGASLLSALEKQDAEALALLRAGQEITVQNAVMQVRQLQVTEAQDALAGLNSYKTLVQTKIDYYQGLVNTGINALETIALGLNMASSIVDDAVALGYALAVPFNFIPQFVLGMSGLGSPVATAELGGASISAASRDAATVLQSVSTALDKTAAVTNIVNSYQRRADEWQFQLDLANAEMTQVENQIAAGNDRVQIATQEQKNQQILIDNANEVNNFLLNKYTNQQLYSWMISQISNVYFSSYQLAYGIAKRAETCFRFELGLQESAYINYGYWNSLKSGLLAGEQMMNDIRQMEMDYMQLNSREFELTKHISLAQFDPVALLQLKQTGACFLNIGEELFDMDYPGQYFRRIKSVSITIPCVAGPYTTISCTLTLTGNSIRISNDATGNYPRKTNASGLPADDSRFGDNSGMIQSIATSSALNDSGLFELNFRDERYLPFEYVGAISSWYLQMPRQFMQFDYNSISDLIIHLRYTARDGGSDLQTAALANLRTTLTSSLADPGLNLYRLFSVRRDFPEAWYGFLNTVDSNGNQGMTLDNTNRFPYFAQNNGMSVQISRVDLLADSGLDSINFVVTSPDQQTLATSLSQSNDTTDQFGGLLYSSQVFGMNKPPAGPWGIGYSAAANAANPGSLGAGNIKDLILVFYYALQQENSPS